MPAFHFPGLLLVLVSVCLQLAATCGSQQDQEQQLGKLTIDDYQGLVIFQDPADDGKSYRVTVAIPKPWETPGIRTERIDVWLLAQGSQALAVTQRPEGEVLIEAGSRGATANAIYFFERSVEPADLAVVVVTVDGQPHAFRIQSPE